MPYQRQRWHFAPFTGEFLWDDFCDTLRQTGCEGDINFETFAQVAKVLKIDGGLLMPWLNMIRHIGESFRKRIQR